LIKDPVKRPSADQLVEHSFLSNSKRDMEKWRTDYMSIVNRYAAKKKKKDGFPFK